MQPTLAEISRRVVADEPKAEHQSCNHRRCGDAAIKLAFHDFKALSALLVLTGSVINKQSRQIENPGEPAHHCNQVKCFYPQHWSAPSILVVVFDVGFQQHPIDTLNHRCDVTLNIKGFYV